MATITHLTEEQKARFGEFRDRWLAIGKSTGPVDVEKAKKIIPEVYKAAGLPPPKYYFHFRSPREAAIMGVRIKYNIDKVKAIDQSNPKLFEPPQIPAAKLKEETQKMINEMIYGSHDASWLSSYSYFLEVCDFKICEKLKPLMDLAEICGWLAPYDDVVILQDRPEFIKMRDRRLHCEDGPALRYSDGFALYRWKGVRIPKEWVEDKAFLTPAKIDAISNVEQRRCATEIFGEKRYIEEGGAEKIHEDDFGILYRKEIPGDEPIMMVCVENGTIENGERRRFFLQVHPELRPLLKDGKLGDPQKFTALNAVASTYGLKGEDYCKIRVRT